ncbi:MAG TPA: DsbA family protein [Candidatus Binatia bacterium]|nr:DsbA family protein [Candidatus Binatia bacterium]
MRVGGAVSWSTVGRFRWLFALLFAGCAAQLHGGSSTPPIASRSATEQRILDYFRKTAVIPPASNLQIVDWKSAGVPGWNQAMLKIDSGFRSQEINFVVSEDGRYLIRGEVVDLTTDPLQSVREKIDLKGQPIRGAADAPVTIVEYSDFQCPFCAKASQTLENDVLPAYLGKVRLVHKNFPLTQIHPWAQNAAVAAECAREQGNDGYWKLYDALFRQQKTITPINLREKVLDVSGAAGLDRQALAKCYDGKATAAQVQADLAEGNALGVNSTPTFFVNGRRLAGAVPADSFRNVIDQELGQR